jgi:hypothetical protein
MNLSGRGLWYRDRHPGRWLAAVLIVLLLVPPLVFIWPVLTDPTRNFVNNKGAIDRVEVTREWQKGNSHYQNLKLHSTTGLEVEIMIRRPVKLEGQHPLVVLLGGYGTGRRAAELVTDPGEVVLVSLTYPYHGDRDIDGLSLLWNLDEIRQAMFDITPAILLTLDHLAKQPYINTERMELVGVSFGAFFVSIPGAMDERFSRVWLVQGAADPESIYEYYLREHIQFNPLRILTAKLIYFVTGSAYLEPGRWVGKISPRPVVVINSHNDDSFPSASVAKLHAALREPYTVQWLESEHVTPGRTEVVKQISNRIVSAIAAEEH